ncbi:NAD(P)H-dependent oxidoreductase [Nitratireductor sp. XY-223]|uniref:NADPH-dependent FMN reductase n=1 Tax=Nitratireductor sp. XY-223 TaxID=2561926 RepID=UPI0010AAFB53|nr:NAD(P)H-dependent oxidoreductase [Nitratireductor sp. XY-223]
MTPRILVFAGSTKSNSINAKLADAAQLVLAQMGADVTRISLLDYPMPIVNEDLKAREGIPMGAMNLGRLIAENEGLFVVSPEYNASIPPLLKNTIDWVSLISDDGGRRLKPWNGRYVALGAASNGKLSGIRCLYHLRAVMMAVGTQVITEQCAVGGASSAFDEDGRVADERAAGMLEKTCRSLVDHCKRHGRAG